MPDATQALLPLASPKAPSKPVSDRCILGRKRKLQRPGPQKPRVLSSDVEIAAPLGALFQGPVADALTHVGQLAMLRRLAGEPMKGENYFKAEIVIGRVGPDQAAPRREF